MECRICDVHITNPLCPGCLGEATEEWLDEHAPERVQALHQEIESLEYGAGETCIKCKQQFAHCMYCTNKHIFNWLRDGTLQLSYLRHFNFLV